jgi:hypothetical protein
MMMTRNIPVLLSAFAPVPDRLHFIGAVTGFARWIDRLVSHEPVATNDNGHMATIAPDAAVLTFELVLRIVGVVKQHGRPRVNAVTDRAILGRPCGAELAEVDVPVTRLAAAVLDPKYLIFKAVFRACLWMAGKAGLREVRPCQRKACVRVCQRRKKRRIKTVDGVTRLACAAVGTSGELCAVDIRVTVGTGLVCQGSLLCVRSVALVAGQPSV